MSSPSAEIHRLRSECGRWRVRVRELEDENRSLKRTLALLDERLKARPRELKPDIDVTKGKS